MRQQQPAAGAHPHPTSTSMAGALGELAHRPPLPAQPASAPIMSASVSRPGTRTISWASAEMRVPFLSSFSIVWSTSHPFSCGEKAVRGAKEGAGQPSYSLRWWQHAQLSLSLQTHAAAGSESAGLQHSRPGSTAAMQRVRACLQLPPHPPACGARRCESPAAWPPCRARGRGAGGRQAGWAEWELQAVRANQQKALKASRRGPEHI